MSRILPLVGAAGLMLGLTACNGGERAVDQAANGTAQGLDKVGDDVGNAVDRAVAPLTPAPSAQDFINTVARSDAFEVAAAKLAQAKSASPQIKAFAGEMIQAHTASTAAIKAAAAKASPAVTPDATLTNGQQDDLDKLNKLSGAAFDRAYADGQVSAHEDALKLLRSYTRDGKDASLKATAASLDPAVARHLGKIKMLRNDPGDNMVPGR